MGSQRRFRCLSYLYVHVRKYCVVALTFYLRSNSEMQGDCGLFVFCTESKLPPEIPLPPALWGWGSWWWHLPTNSITVSSTSTVSFRLFGLFEVGLSGFFPLLQLLKMAWSLCVRVCVLSCALSLILDGCLLCCTWTYITFGFTDQVIWSYPRAL